MVLGQGEKFFRAGQKRLRLGFHRLQCNGFGPVQSAPNGARVASIRSKPILLQAFRFMAFRQTRLVGIVGVPKMVPKWQTRGRVRLDESEAAGLDSLGFGHAWDDPQTERTGRR